MLSERRQIRGLCVVAALSIWIIGWHLETRISYAESAADEAFSYAMAARYEAEEADEKAEEAVELAAEALDESEEAKDQAEEAQYSADTALQRVGYVCLISGC